MPSVTASITLRMCGICVADWTTSSPLERLRDDETPRGSIAAGIRRCCTYRSRTVCAAEAKAASTASGSGMSDHV